MPTFAMARPLKSRACRREQTRRRRRAPRACAGSPTRRPESCASRAGADSSTGGPTDRWWAIRTPSRASARSSIPPAWTDVWICPRADGPHPGDGPRRARAQAVPLPPALARGARRDEVRPHDRVRRGAARASARASTATSRVAACRARRCSPPSCGSSSTTLHPRRQRGVRARQRLVRPDHAAHAPRRACAGSTAPLPVPRQERQVEHEVGVERPRASRDRPALPGPARAGALPVRRRRRRAHAIGPRRRERLPARDRRAPTSPARTSAPGRARVLAACALARDAARRRAASGAAGRVVAAVKRSSRRGSATRPRCAASATSILPCCRRSRRAARSRRARRPPRSRGRGAPASSARC